MTDDVLVRAYRADDERAWVFCRVLSFLGSAFFDDVRREKDHYEHPAIDLVAERSGAIVGLIDVECEEEPGSVCSDRPGLGGMIWHIAVHPDHQRQASGRRARRGGCGCEAAWSGSRRPAPATPGVEHRGWRLRTAPS